MVFCRALYFCLTLPTEDNSVFRNTQTLIIMTIKGMNGENYSVTGQGQGNYNTVAGSLGLASFLGLNAGNVLGGWGNRNMGYPNAPIEVITSDDKPITRNEAKMMQELGVKDSEIALLKADKYTDQKIVETTTYLMGKINEVSAEVRANKDAEGAVNTQQAVYNGTNTATLGCLQRQVDELASMSKRVIPSSNVCDIDCCRNS